MVVENRVHCNNLRNDFAAMFLVILEPGLDNKRSWTLGHFSIFFHFPSLLIEPPIGKRNIVCNTVLIARRIASHALDDLKKFTEQDRF